MNAKEDKRQKSMKSKLIAAIAMLTVAVIMMVSTTYAWFTLSTAPEVTGITTAVGANGNLEMALVPETGTLTDIKSEAGDGLKEIKLKNNTWGNLVDVSSDLDYGLNQIELMPSKLNTTTVAEVTKLNTTTMLQTPEYGSDGRVTQLVEKTGTGVFNTTETAFFQNETARGVRAVGVSSGMSARALAHRNALAAAATYASNAKVLASRSLSDNGGDLGSIALIHVQGSDDGKYTDTEVGYLETIANALLSGSYETPGSLEYIDMAISNYLVVLAASKVVPNDAAGDLVYSAIANMIAEGKSSKEISTELATEYNITIPDQLNTLITNLEATKETVGEAKAELNALSGNSYTWAQISSPMNKIADMDKMTINGKLLSVGRDELVKQMMNDLTAGKGITLTLNTGAGVFADIADYCGDYQANVTMNNISVSGLTVDTVNATMKTSSSVNPSYLSAMGTLLKGDDYKAPASAAGAMPISEFYGYVIDLAFRTNAAASDLMLQTTPVDRIYEGNGVDETMGHGSTMTFAASSSEITNTMMTNLMKCLRVVFFNPADGEIYGEARLDTTNAVVGGEVTAPLMLVDTVAADGTVTFKTEENAKLMPLTQNTAAELSALVYLDGENLTNADVANAAQSMSGSMNLQFSSSATLNPMDYADLMGQGTQADGE